MNGEKRWPDRSSRTVNLPLPDWVRFDDIKGVRLETTFGGGVGGDNWNLDRLTVSARSAAVNRQFFDQRGAPLSGSRATSACVTTTVLVLRAHYTMDVFTGAVTALWVWTAASAIAPGLDRWLAGLFG